MLPRHGTDFLSKTFYSFILKKFKAPHSKEFQLLLFSLNDIRSCELSNGIADHELEIHRDHAQDIVLYWIP